MDKSQEEYAIEEAAGVAISLAFKREGLTAPVVFICWLRAKDHQGPAETNRMTRRGIYRQIYDVLKSQLGVSGKVRYPEELTTLVRLRYPDPKGVEGQYDAQNNNARLITYQELKSCNWYNV